MQRRIVSIAGTMVGGAVVVSLLTGCFASGKKPTTDRASRKSKDAEEIVLVWPEPPNKPRIRFVRTLASETDLGRTMKASETFRKFITGDKPSVSKLYQPRDVAVSDDGQRIYVSDYAQYLVFVFDLENNEIRHLGKEDPFARPFGVALDADENLYVVEQAGRRIRVLDRDGIELRTITHETLVRPTDIAIDRERGRMYVADPATKDSEEHVVKVFALDGEFIGTIGDGKGDCEGCLFFPTFVGVDGEGRVYVSNTLNARVEVFDAEGTYERTIGHRGTVFGEFDKPKGVAVDSFGNIYVVDSGWSNVQIFNTNGEVLLFFGGRGTYPGLLRNPTGIALDANNRIYIADYLNYRVTVYELINTESEDSFIDPDEQAEAVELAAN